METKILNIFMLVQIKEDKKNLIKPVIDEQHRVHNKAETVDKAFWDYFSRLFTSVAPNSKEILHVSSTI